MRRVISKRIRHNKGGVNIAADIDAVIAINTGDDAKLSHTVAHSSHTVAQGARTEPDTSPPDADDPPKEKP